MRNKTIMLAAFLAGCVGCSGIPNHDTILSWEEKHCKKIERQEEQAQTVESLYYSLIGKKNSAEKGILPEGERAPSQAEIEKAEKKAGNAWEKHAQLIKEVPVRLQKYLNKNPDDYEARDRLGHFYADRQMNHEAEEVWRELIRRNPNYASAYNNIGTLYDHSNLEKKMEAIELFRKTIELAPTEFPNAYFNLGNYYSLLRKNVSEKFGWDMPRIFRETTSAFCKACELEPENADYAQAYATSFIVAKYFGVSGVTDESITAWNKYLAIKSLTPNQRAFGLISEARVYLREKGDKKTAKSLLEQAIQLYPATSAEDMLRECEK